MHKSSNFSTSLTDLGLDHAQPHEAAPLGTLGQTEETEQNFREEKVGSHNDFEPPEKVKRVLLLNSN